MPTSFQSSNTMRSTTTTATRRLSQVSSHLSTSSTSSPPPSQPRRRSLAPKSTEFRYFLPFQSTWRDNDQYQHFNNVIYSQYFDSITNEFLLNKCKMSESRNDPIGLIVHSETEFSSQLSYPQPVLCGLAIKELSNRKIVWKLGLFKAEYITENDNNNNDHDGMKVKVNGQEEEEGGRRIFGKRVRIARNPENGQEELRAAAYGTMTHVFVERGHQERNKVVESLPENWKEKLKTLVVQEEEESTEE